MENKGKILITDALVGEITDFAHYQFGYERNLSRFSLDEMRVFLILHGLERLLIKNGIDPGFEIAKLKIEDSLPVDDSGLDEIEQPAEEPQS